MLSNFRRRMNSSQRSLSSLHPVNRTDIGETVKDSAELLLDATVELSGALPPLQAAAKSLQVIVKYIEKIVQNKDEIRKLEKYILQSAHDTADLRGEPGEWWRTELFRTLEDVVRKLQPLLYHDRRRQAVEASRVEAAIKDSITVIERALNRYQSSLTQQIHQRIVQQSIDDENIILDHLDRAKDAAFDASDTRRSCLPGTRAGVQQALQDWAAKTNEQCVYWLNGIAGSGKTTIAQSFAEFLSAPGEKPELCASFFCSRASAQRSDCKLIFPTIAYQLACYDRPGRRFLYRNALLTTLRKKQNIASLSLWRQIEELIVVPVERSRISAIIVIDALDECKDIESVSLILELLSEFASRIPTIKWFIASRPEHHIRDKFRQPSLHLITKTMILHEVGKTSVEGDIRRFLTTSLQAIDELILEGPKLQKNIDTLTKRSAGLFIFASTAVKFIANDRAEGLPVNRLNQILAQSPTSRVQDQDNPYRDLDALYLDVLSSASTRTNSRHIHEILDLLAVAEEPLSADMLAGLLAMNSTVVMSSLKGLHSILLVPDNRVDPIKFHHTSLVDFLTDHTRCLDSRYLIRMRYAHFKLASSCVELLETHLSERACSCNTIRSMTEANDRMQQRNPQSGFLGPPESAMSKHRYTCSNYIKYCREHIRGHYVGCLGLVEASEASNRSLPTLILQSFKLVLLLVALSVVHEYQHAMRVLRWMREYVIPSGVSAVSHSVEEILPDFDPSSSRTYGRRGTVSWKNGPLSSWKGMNSFPEWLVISTFYSLIAYFVAWLAFASCISTGVASLPDICKRFGLLSVVFALRWARTYYLLRYQPRGSTSVTSGQTIGFLAVLFFRIVVTSICGLCYDVFFIVLRKFRQRQ